MYVRDWSLITGGGLQNRNFYLYEKGGGGRQRFSHAEVGAQKVLG